MGSSMVNRPPRETLGQGQAILDFYPRQGVVTLWEWVS
jgi:hypothetical protein